LHRYNVLLAEAKVDHQTLQNSALQRTNILATSSDEDLSFYSEEAA
jgi:hypothetical protein